MLSFASKLLGKSAAAETHIGIIGCTGIKIHNGLGFRVYVLGLCGDNGKENGSYDNVGNTGIYFCPSTLGPRCHART